MAHGFPGRATTRFLTPGAEYACTTSAFGPQLRSCLSTAPRYAAVRSRRTDAERQYLGRGHDTALLAHGSPGPFRYDTRTGHGALGRQLRSSARTSAGCGFGTGSRFSQAQVRPASAVAGGARSAPHSDGRDGALTGLERAGRTPGPGEYRVQ